MQIARRRKRKQNITLEGGVGGCTYPSDVESHRSSLGSRVSLRSSPSGSESKTTTSGNVDGPRITPPKVPKGRRRALLGLGLLPSPYSMLIPFLGVGTLSVKGGAGGAAGAGAPPSTPPDPPAFAASAMMIFGADIAAFPRAHTRGFRKGKKVAKDLTISRGAGNEQRIGIPIELMAGHVRGGGRPCSGIWCYVL